MYVKENHGKNNNKFAKLKERDQQAYWGWRHEHAVPVVGPHRMKLAFLDEAHFPRCFNSRSNY
jgi:hypothetical protein